MSTKGYRTSMKSGGRQTHFKPLQHFGKSLAFGQCLLHFENWGLLLTIKSLIDKSIKKELDIVQLLVVFNCIVRLAFHDYVLNSFVC